LDPVALDVLRQRMAARLGSDVPFFLAGSAAVVTGRGEHVDPLPPLRGPAPGLLLVTPAASVATAEVFAVFDADPSARPHDARSTRASSEHLAAEWRAGLRSDALVSRAGVLASANDLAEAADVVLPGLRPLRRALVRVLHRPVGLSGSGPTLWVLYASKTEAMLAAADVRAGLDDGTIVAPGAGRPSIVATTILGPGPAPVADPGHAGETGQEGTA
jgi:4-diphosphocytidyl-2-C-methyl-D-erythritol kinase